MAKYKGNSMKSLASSFRTFIRSTTFPRLANEMNGSVGVSAEADSLPPSFIQNNLRIRQSPPILCAPNEHPLFVSDEQEDDEDDVCKVLDLSEPETFPPNVVEAGNIEANMVAVDKAGTNTEYEVPLGETDRLPKHLPCSSSSLESDGEGQKLDSSLEDNYHRNLSFVNEMKVHSGSSLSSNGLESSCEVDGNMISTKPQATQDAKSNEKLDFSSGDSSQDAILNKSANKNSQRVENQKNSKPQSQNVDVVKKPKAKLESSGNNLVFAYRKNAEEVEIREVPSEDSDVEAESLERGDGQGDAGAADDATNQINSQVLHPAADGLYSQDQLRNSRSGAEIKKSTSKKKQSTWGFVLNPNYKFRHIEFKRIFRNIPRSDRLIVDYSCALQRNILIQGRLYISQNWVCFYASIFGVETTLSIQFSEITHITKEKTARVFPNAIQISTKDEKHFFSSLNARDKTYLILSHFWQSANSQEPMSQEEMWTWIHYSYGEDLGVSHDDQDYVPLSPEEKAKQLAKIEHEATMHQDVEGLGTTMHSRDNQIEEAASLESEQSHKKSTVNSSLSQTPIVSKAKDIDEEIQCCGHDHLPIQVCDEVLNFSVDKLFQYCFTDSHIFRQFTEIKKTSDVVLAAWPEPSVTNDELVRNISYTLSLNLAMTSKRAPATEKQTMHRTSKPGKIYIIDSECHTPTIPYGDSFYIVNRYCLTHVAESKSRIRITSQLVYQKNVFFKSFIEKNATSGILETFMVLVNLLRKESRFQSGGDKDLPIVDLPTAKIEQPASNVDLAESVLMWECVMKNVRSMKFLSFLVLIIAVIMATMMFRFWSYGGEHSVGTRGMLLSNQKGSDLELIKLLQLQVREQQIEIDKWKNEVSNMVKTMNELRETIKDLLQQRSDQH